MEVEPHRGRLEAGATAGRARRRYRVDDTQQRLADELQRRQPQLALRRCG